MKLRGLIFAAALLVALCGILYWSSHHKSAEPVQASVDAPVKILVLNEADVSRIDLRKKGDQQLVLAKDSAGKWQITSPKPLNADQPAVSSLLSTLSSLNSERVVEEKPESLTQYGLLQPTLEVDVTGKNNTKSKVLIGDDTPTGNGSYVKLADDPRVFTIASYTKNSLDKGLNDFRDKRLLSVEPDRISRLDLIANGQEIQFGRSKDQWQILKPKPLRADTFQVDELVRKLGAAKMDTSSTDTKTAASAFASGKLVATATLTTDAGSQQLQVRKNKDDYYAKSSIVEGVCKVSNDLGQGFDKKLEDFRNKKLFDLAEPEKIEIHNGSQTYFLTRSGNDWWSADRKKLDLSSAEALIDRIRDLRATKFVDSGFGTATMQIKVTPASGKPWEEVLISKKGSEHIAKRQNEPALYVLDSTAVEQLEKSMNELKPAVTSAK